MSEEHPEILLPAIWKGVWAGRRTAIRMARMHGTKMAIWEDGQVKHITPDEAEQRMAQAWNPYPEDDPGPDEPTRQNTDVVPGQP